MAAETDVSPLRIVTGQAFACEDIAAGEDHGFELDLDSGSENLSRESAQASHDSLADPSGDEAVFDGNAEDATLE